MPPLLFALLVVLFAGLAPEVAIAQAEAPASDTMDQSTARAEDIADLRAREHFGVGRTYYQAGRFAEAAAEFQTAYDLSRRPDLFYNLYVAYRDALQLERARDALREYLLAVEDIPNRPYLRTRLVALEGQIEQERAEREQREAALQAEREASSRAIAEADAARRRAEADANVARMRQRPWWPWSLVGAGAAFIAVGVGIGVDATARADALRAACTTPNPVQGEPPIRTCPGDPTQELLGEPLTQRRSILMEAAASDGLWIAGAAIATAGVILALAVDDDVPTLDASSARIGGARIEGGCSPTGCVGALSLSF